MYAIVRTYVRLDNIWQFKDISDETISEVRANYSNFRIVVTWDSGSVESEIHFKDIEDLLSTVTGTLTVEEWLATYTSADVPARTEIQRLSTARCVSFTDLHNYAFDFIGRGNNTYAPDAKLPIGEDVDLMLGNSYPDSDQGSVYNIAKNGILCSNGRMLRTVGHDGFVYGVNAHYEAGDFKQENYSILDFTEVGGIIKKDFTEDMLTVLPRTVNDISLSRTRVIIDTGEDLTNLTPLASLDGYLSYKNHEIKIFNKTSIKISISHKTVITRASRRLHEALTWIGAANVRDEGLRAETFDALEFFKANTSFLILIQNPEVSIIEEPVEYSGINGFYVHYRYPKGILMSEKGRMLPYFVNDYDKDVVSLAVGDVTKRITLTSETVPWADDNVYAQATYNDPIKKPQAAKIVDIFVL